MAKKYTVPGPCHVNFGGHDLGSTKQGVTLRPRTTWIPVVDDSHGTEPADYIFGGKSCIVDAVFNQPAPIKAATMFLGGLLTIQDVGELVFDGDDPDSGDNIGVELIITERVPTNQWRAWYVAPSDPQQIALLSTQESMFPITFNVVPDADGNLFYEVPGYIDS